MNRESFKIQYAKCVNQYKFNQNANYKRLPRHLKSSQSTISSRYIDLKIRNRHRFDC